MSRTIMALGPLPSDGAVGFGYLDEGAKRELRQAILTAVCVPGYQVPFGSREMPIARGWGSGGLQVTLAIIGAQDVLKVMDQGDDAGVNAANLRRFIRRVTGLPATTSAADATVIQSRHRVPEQPLVSGQILILQVPSPEPLRFVERRPAEQKRMHAEEDYAAIWVSLYEDRVRNGLVTKSNGYPCVVDNRYVVSPSPIPRWDVPRLDSVPHLTLFGAGREKRIYAIPPHTKVVPLAFDDIPFAVEETNGASCSRCASRESYLVEVPGQDRWVCSDTNWCQQRQDELMVPVVGQ